MHLKTPRETCTAHSTMHLKTPRETCTAHSTQHTAHPFLSLLHSQCHSCTRDPLKDMQHTAHPFFHSCTLNVILALITIVSSILQDPAAAYPMPSNISHKLCQCLPTWCCLWQRLSRRVWSSPWNPHHCSTRWALGWDTLFRATPWENRETLRFKDLKTSDNLKDVKT